VCSAATDSSGQNRGGAGPAQLENCSGSTSESAPLFIPHLSSSRSLRSSYVEFSLPSRFPYCPRFVSSRASSLPAPPFQCSLCQPAWSRFCSCSPPLCTRVSSPVLASPTSKNMAAWTATKLNEASAREEAKPIHNAEAPYARSSGGPPPTPEGRGKTSVGLAAGNWDAYSSPRPGNQGRAGGASAKRLGCRIHEHA